MNKKVRVVDRRIRRRHAPAVFDGDYDCVDLFVKEEEIILFFYTFQDGLLETILMMEAVKKFSREVGIYISRYSGCNLYTRRLEVKPEKPEFKISGFEWDQNLPEAEAALAEYLKSQGA